MDVIFDIILGRILIRFIGAWTRYYFLRLIGYNSKIKEIIWKKGDMNQDFTNAVVGISLCAFLFYLLSFF
jgi:hypothetical protein